MIVVDTNTIAYFYLNSDKKEIAEAVNTRDPDWLAPLLWKSEFRNVLTLYLRRDLMSIEEVLSLAKQVEEEMAERELAVDSDRVLKLAEATSCSAYDCEFVALAQHLDIALVTNDKRVLKAFPATAVSLEDFTKPPAADEN